MIIVGQGALARRRDGEADRPRIALARIARCRRRADGWNGFNVLHTAAAASAARYRLRAGRGRRLLADQIKLAGRSTCCSCSAPTRSTCPRWASAFVVYIGTHGDAARTAPTSSCRARPTPRSPAPTSTPRAGCRCQPRRLPAGRRREDWAILRALSAVLGSRCRSTRCAAARAMYAEFPHLRADRPDRGRRAADVKRAWRKGRRARSAGASQSPVDRFLSDQPDRARLGGHGGMLGARRGLKQAAE
jgi:NADH-quinone oxidoreductase subunit G